MDIYCSKCSILQTRDLYWNFGPWTEAEKDYRDTLWYSRIVYSLEENIPDDLSTDHFYIVHHIKFFGGPSFQDADPLVECNGEGLRTYLCRCWDLIRPDILSGSRYDDPMERHTSKLALSLDVIFTPSSLTAWSLSGNGSP